MQVGKWGNSLAVRLPAAVVEALGLKEGDEIQIEIAGERTFRVERDRTREERLTRPGRTIEKDTLRLCDAERLEELWVLDGQLNNFLDLLDLLVEATDHLVCAVWYLLDHHE